MRGALLALALASAAPSFAAPSSGGEPVIELRQYKIFPGKRDAMIDLFERHFIESQEQVGARLIGQFRDRDDPDRFTWIRGFEDMDVRGKALNGFYYGPVWQAHRDAANALLDDNDNVLLLHPAFEGSGFTAAGPRAASGAIPAAGGMIVATVEYLWKDPNSDFVAFFRARMMPLLARAGLSVIASYVPENQPNNFPRLPVRQGEKLLVWFTRATDQASYDRARERLQSEDTWKQIVTPQLARFEERAPQVLRLQPTPRSALR